MTGQICSYSRDAVESRFGASKADKTDRMQSVSNAGLVFSRYLGLWEAGSPPKLIKGEERRAILRTFVSDFNARCKLPNSASVKLLNEVHARQSRVSPQQLDRSVSFQIKLETRFATGLGSPHPTEIGFTFHRAIGVPYMPGSSVKGIARAAAEMSGEPLTELLFGPVEREGKSSAAIGDLIFLDAYPTSWPELSVDIINSHHSTYYADPSRSYPSETESPIPVYFLTVAPGTAWTFRVMSRSGHHAPRGAAALQWGLKHLGAGAKTAVGYGFFGG
jgi:CRISPR-associated protein Cmr6